MVRFILSSSLKILVEWEGAHLGGNANNSTNDGFAYVNSTNTPSDANANIGSRLYWKYLANGLSPWEKLNHCIFVWVLTFVGIVTYTLSTIQPCLLAKKYSWPVSGSSVDETDDRKLPTQC